MFDQETNIRHFCGIITTRVRDNTDPPISSELTRDHWFLTVICGLDTKTASLHMCEDSRSESVCVCFQLHDTELGKHTHTLIMLTEPSS